MVWEDTAGTRELNKIQSRIRKTLIVFEIWREADSRKVEDVDPDGVASLSSLSVEGYFRKTGSEQNTVRDLGTRWRDTECDCQTRSKISWNLATDASLEKNDIGNSDEKILGCAFKTLLSRPYKLTSVLSVLCPTFCNLLYWPVFSSESVSNCIRTAKWVKWLQLHSVLESFNHLTWHPRPDQPTGLQEE